MCVKKKIVNGYITFYNKNSLQVMCNNNKQLKMRSTINSNTVCCIWILLILFEFNPWSKSFLILLYIFSGQTLGYHDSFSFKINIDEVYIIRDRSNTHDIVSDVCEYSGVVFVSTSNFIVIILSKNFIGIMVF